ncbi:MAG: tetratricopeptide repeat protein [Fibrobacterota bacterium]
MGKSRFLRPFTYFSIAVLLSAAAAAALFLYTQRDHLFIPGSRKSSQKLFKAGKPRQGLRNINSLPPQERGTAENLLWKGKFSYLATWKKYNDSAWKSYGTDPDDWFSSPLLEEGVTALKRAAEVEETFEEASLYLGLIYMEKGQYQRSAKHFRSLLQHNPDHPLGLLNYGILLSRMEQYERSVRVLEKGLALDTKKKNFLKNLFWIHAFKLKSYEEAISYGDRYLRASKGKNDFYDKPKVTTDMRAILARFPEYDSDTLVIHRDEPREFKPRRSAVRMREKKRGNDNEN